MRFHHIDFSLIEIETRLRRVTRIEFELEHEVGTLLRGSHFKYQMSPPSGIDLLAKTDFGGTPAIDEDSQVHGVVIPAVVWKPGQSAGIFQVKTADGRLATTDFSGNVPDQEDRGIVPVTEANGSLWA